MYLIRFMYLITASCTWLQLHVPHCSFMYLITASFTWLQLHVPDYSIMYLITASWTWLLLHVPDYNFMYLIAASCTNSASRTDSWDSSFTLVFNGSFSSSIQKPNIVNRFVLILRKIFFFVEFKVFFYKI